MIRCWQTFGIFGLAACALTFGALPGCGRAAPAETAAADEESQVEDVDTGDESTADRKPARRSRRKPKKPQGPQIGGIPLDAFGTEPIVAASAPAAPSAKAPAAPMTAAPSAPATEPATTDAPTATASAGGAGGWDAVLTPDAVTSEIKLVRMQMKDSLATVSKYNGQYKTSIQKNMASIAALANVVAQDPSMNVSWKSDAKYVRDMAVEVASKADGLDKGPYEATKKAWEDLDELFNGNKPPKLPDSADKLPFSPEIVKRGAAMKRMDEAYNTLKSTFGSEAVLKKEPEKALHEASVLATLTRIVGMEGYDSADDDEYKGFITEMDKYNGEMIAAIKAGDFSGFNDSLGRVYKTCNACHSAGFKP